MTAVAAATLNPLNLSSVSPHKSSWVPLVPSERRAVPLPTSKLRNLLRFSEVEGHAPRVKCTAHDPDCRGGLGKTRVWGTQERGVNLWGPSFVSGLRCESPSLPQLGRGPPRPRPQPCSQGGGRTPSPGETVELLAKLPCALY